LRLKHDEGEIWLKIEAAITLVLSSRASSQSAIKA
jgi:hypothetical protein